MDKQECYLCTGLSVRVPARSHWLSWEAAVFMCFASADIFLHIFFFYWGGVHIQFQLLSVALRLPLAVSLYLFLSVSLSQVGQPARGSLRDAGCGGREEGWGDLWDTLE